MPIRTASLTKRLSENGQALHRARMSREGAEGADRKPSEAELVLEQERQALKGEREKRRERASQPKPSAVERLVRTHHAQPKEKPKATKEAKDAVKKPKPRRSRAEKHAEKAAALEAARRSKKQPAK
jgi:hypothetical protein